MRRKRTRSASGEQGEVHGPGFELCGQGVAVEREQVQSHVGRACRELLEQGSENGHEVIGDGEAEPSLRLGRVEGRRLVLGGEPHLEGAALPVQQVGLVVDGALVELEHPRHGIGIVGPAAGAVDVDHGLQLQVARRRVLLEERHEGEKKARGAEATLQRVRLAKRLLQRMQLARLGGEPLDRGELAAVKLHRKEQAGAHRVTIEQHGAGAADAVLAADVGTGEPELVAQEVAQQQARLDAALVQPAVDPDLDLDELLFLHPADTSQPGTLALA